MTNTYGAGPYGRVPWGGTSADPDVAITTTTVARAVAIPVPRIGGFVAGGDVIYLIASHDPSVLVVAHRGTPKVASHVPALSHKAGHADALAKVATASQPIP